MFGVVATARGPRRRARRPRGAACARLARCRSVLAAELGDVDAVRRRRRRRPGAVGARDAERIDGVARRVVLGPASDVAELLLGAGADPRAITEDEFLRIPVLGSAIATTPGVPQPSDDEDVVLRLVRMLLEHGAEPDQTRRDGMTALHSAAWRGLDRVVQELLDAGADRTRRATDGPHAGQTPRRRRPRPGPPRARQPPRQWRARRRVALRLTVAPTRQVVARGSTVPRQVLPRDPPACAFLARSVGRAAVHRAVRAHMRPATARSAGRSPPWRRRRSRCDRAS